MRVRVRVTCASMEGSAASIASTSRERRASMCLVRARLRSRVGVRLRA